MVSNRIDFDTLAVELVKMFEFERDPDKLRERLAADLRDAFQAGGRAMLRGVSTEPRVGRYSHLVVISREGALEVRGFHNLETAAAWENYAGGQWSESYLCEVIKGPLT